MVFTLLLFIGIVVAFVFIYFKQKTLQYKVITSVFIALLAIILFYVVVIVLWNSAEDPARERSLQNTVRDSISS